MIKVYLSSIQFDLKNKMIQNSDPKIPETAQQDEQQQQKIQQTPQVSILCPYRLLTGHWMTISRPQYKRTCGISSLVSIWNFQFSRLGLGTKDPICIEQAMLKLNLIGNGSMEENFRKKFKKDVKQLTQANKQSKDPNQQDEGDDAQISMNDKNLHQYIDSVDFGVFTGNDALLKWYRLLCRIYGGSGRSYMFYKTNSERSKYKDQLSAKRGLVEGLNSNGKTCFIYHAHDHYFCPVGYQMTPNSQQITGDKFESESITLEDNLCVLVGQSSKMFSCIHSFNWSQVQLDLTTYYPKKFNIRRPKQGVTVAKGKQNIIPSNSTINCIMAFEKMKD